MLTTLWFVLIGFLVVNGTPHFVMGSAGRPFRSPFGRQSPPRVNIGWGLANVILATILIVWRVTAQAPRTGEWIALIVGFWLGIILFAAGAKRFFDERKSASDIEK